MSSGYNMYKKHYWSNIFTLKGVEIYTGTAHMKIQYECKVCLKRWDWGPCWEIKFKDCVVWNRVKMATGEWTEGNRRHNLVYNEEITQTLKHTELLNIKKSQRVNKWHIEQKLKMQFRALNGSHLSPNRIVFTNCICWLWIHISGGLCATLVGCLEK